MSNRLLDAALEYARHGLKVFPAHTPTDAGACSCGDPKCHSIGKHPRPKNGYKAATTDEDQILAWWQRWPDANIGISCADSGIVVIDIDPRNGGNETWKRIEGDHFLSKTPVARTGGHKDGRHIYMTYKADLPAKLGPGVDVKKNGYVIAPPSKHASGRKYEWITALNGVAPIEPPSWVRPVGGITVEQTDSTLNACITIRDRWLDNVQAAREGERNNTLNKAAWVIGGLLHLGKLDEGECSEMLADAARFCGLDDIEAEKTIRSGLRGGQEQPLRLDEAEAARPTTFTPLAMPAEPDETESDPWGAPYTLKDAYSPRSPLVYVVEGVLTAASVNIVFGDSGSLKSMLMADLCAAVVGGQTWLKEISGSGGLRTKAGPVMWIDFDNGSRRTHERFGAFGRARRIPETAPILYYSMPQPTLEAAKSEHMGQLYRRITENRVQLLIVDNLSLVSGAIDENSRDMAQVIAGFRWLAEYTQVAAVIIHHQNKPSGIGRKTGDLLRGHSSIKAGVDVALYVAREGEAETVTNDVFVTAPKARDAEIAPFAARFNYTQTPRKELETAWFVGIDWKDAKSRAQESKREEREEDTERKIIDFLKDRGASTKTEMKAANLASWNAITDTVSRLVISGVLKTREVVKKGGRGTEYFIE